MERGCSGALLYRCVRGTCLHAGQHVNVPGAGDFTIGALAVIDHTYPLASAATAVRTLRTQARRLCASMCDASGLAMYENATYVDLPRNRSHFTHGDDAIPGLQHRDRRQ